MPVPPADAARFEQLLRENQSLVYRIAFSVVRNRSDAEDVTQDVFLQAYRKWKGPEAGPIRSWLARVAWRMALNHRRSSSRAMERETHWLNSRPHGSEDHTDMQALRQEVERLPEKLRQVLTLSALDELDARDVATILEIPEGTVRSRLHQARKLLLRALYP